VRKSRKVQRQESPQADQSAFLNTTICQTLRKNWKESCAHSRRRLEEKDANIQSFVETSEINIYENYTLES
jgi:hypothetical protein